MVRYTVHYSGNVQGVGFRYTTANVARRYRVAGYVQNLPDGRVKIVAEGEPDQVEHFLEAVHRVMCRLIHDQQIEKGEATGEYGRPEDPDTFGVRY